MEHLKKLLLTTGILVCSYVYAQPNYSGAYGDDPSCEACHASGSQEMNQFTHWNMTAHAGAYTNHSALQWNDSCLPCHTTGWDISLSNGGFDDFFYSGDTLGMLQMANVQCEVCHGPTDEYPHPQSTYVDCGSEVCGSCHNQPGSNFYDEWSGSGHAVIAPVGTQQIECARCHEAASAALFLSTEEAPTSLPGDPHWQITCAACHTSHNPRLYANQLRQEPPDPTCRTCHNMEEATVGEEPHSPQENMLYGPGNGGYEWPGYFYNNSCHWMYLPEPCVMCHMYPQSYGNPDTSTTGHSLDPDILLCATSGCHGLEIPPDSSFNIAGVYEIIDSLTTALDSTLQLADSTRIEYAQALFDLQFVLNDGSRGVHNFFYARDLLISSIEGIQGILITEEEEIPLHPEQFVLYPPHPNPFNPTTTISYELPVASFVRLDVFDITGRLVNVSGSGTTPTTEHFTPGKHEVTFDATGLSSGIYIYRLQAGDHVASGKMVLMK